MWTASAWVVCCGCQERITPLTAPQQDELWRDASPEGPSGASQCWLMWHPPGVVAAWNVGEKTDAVNMNKVTKKCERDMS